MKQDTQHQESNRLPRRMTLKDYLVSGEHFELVYLENQRCYQTQPQPDSNDLPSYYKSEDYISHTKAWRNPFELIYHWIRRISHNRKYRLIKKLGTSGNTLLDFGCGTGSFLKYMHDRNWDCYGMEPDQDARAIAEAQIGRSISKNWQSIPGSMQFDIITLWHVLEHLPDPHAMLREFHQRLKPGGYLILALPNFQSYDAQYYKEIWAAFDVPRHLWHFSKQSIDILAQQTNFELRDIHPLKWDAYYVSMLSEKYKNNHGYWWAGFLTGWRSNRKAKASGEYSSLIYVLKKA